MRFLTASAPPVVIFILLAVLSTSIHAQDVFGSGLGGGLEEVAGWNFLNFDGADPNSFMPQDPVFTGVTVWRDRIFLSIPRLRDGVPATLAWIPRTAHPTLNPPLIPFPDWSWQQGHVNNCTGLASVYRSRIDRCGRLWVLDSGVTLQRNQVCPPRLFVFDLEQEVLIKVITVPPQVITPTSILTFSVFDYYDHSPRCDATFMYIADTLGYGLLSYDVTHNVFWRFEDMSFRNDPQFGTFQIAGEQGTVQDGILGMAIGNLGGEPMLFYHPFSSITMYAVPVGALRNPQSPNLPVIKVLDQTSQGVGMTSDAHGNIIYSPLSETSVVKFEPNKLEQRVIVQDVERLQFLPDIEVDHEGSIWMISNKFQSWNSNTYDPRNVNLRVLRIPFATRRPAVRPLNRYGTFSAPFSWGNIFSLK